MLLQSIGKHLMHSKITHKISLESDVDTPNYSSFVVLQHFPLKRI
jgi:hypothetical protein